MNDLIPIIIGYLIVSGTLTFVVFAKTKHLPIRKKKLVRSAILAAFYAPASIWIFPFQFPSPAMIAMATSIYLIGTSEFSRLLLGNVIFAFIPYLIFVLIYYLGYTLLVWFNNKRHGSNL